MQIRYKLLKLKDFCEIVLKEVTCPNSPKRSYLWLTKVLNKRSYLWLTKVLNKSVKSIKKVLQEVKFVQKSPPAENPHHAETSQSTRNASKVTGCNKTRAQNQKRPQNRPDYHKYLLFHNIN